MRRLGRARGRCVQEGAVWRVKLKTEPIGLGFNGTWTGAVDRGGGGLCDTGCGRVRRLG